MFDWSALTVRAFQISSSILFHNTGRPIDNDFLCTLFFGICAINLFSDLVLFLDQKPLFLNIFIGNFDSESEKFGCIN